MALFQSATGPEGPSWSRDFSSQFPLKINIPYTTMKLTQEAFFKPLVVITNFYKSHAVLRAFCEFSHVSFMTTHEIGTAASHTLQVRTLGQRDEQFAQGHKAGERRSWGEPRHSHSRAWDLLTTTPHYLTNLRGSGQSIRIQMDAYSTGVLGQIKKVDSHYI